MHGDTQPDDRVAIVVAIKLMDKTKRHIGEGASFLTCIPPDSNVVLPIPPSGATATYGDNRQLRTRSSSTASLLETSYRDLSSRRHCVVAVSKHAKTKCMAVIMLSVECADHLDSLRQQCSRQDPEVSSFSPVDAHLSRLQNDAPTTCCHESS